MPNEATSSGLPTSRSVPNFQSAVYQKRRESTDEWLQFGLRSNQLKSDYQRPNGMCKHKYPCAQNALVKGFLRSFAAGYGFKTSLALGVALFRGTLFKNPVKVLRSIYGSQDALRFGQFIGCMSGAYKIVTCLLRYYLKQDQPWQQFVAGAVAATAILLDAPDRRNTLALYIVVRAVDEFLCLLAQRGVIPTVKNAYVYVFALCQAPNMFSLMHQPAALDKSYYGWIKRMGNLQEADIAYTFRQPASAGFMPCHPRFHPETSCVRANINDWFRCLLRAGRIYLPVHFLPALLFSPSYVFNNPQSYLMSSVRNTCWSTLFLATYVFNMKSFVCLFRNMLQRDPGWIMALAGLNTGFALWLENPKRHGELALYCTPRAIQTTCNIFPSITRLFKSIPLGNVLMFQLGLGLFSYCRTVDMRNASKRERVKSSTSSGSSSAGKSGNNSSARGDKAYKMKRLNATVLRVVFGSRQ